MQGKIKTSRGQPKAKAANGAEADRLATQLQALETTMPPAMLRVAHYLNRNRIAALAHSAAELAAMIGTSDATVIRTVQTLGFQGLSELRQSIATSIDENSTALHNMHQTLEELSSKAGEAAAHAADVVIDTHSEFLLKLQEPEARGQIHAAIAILHSVERIVIYAAGPSKALAEYLKILLGRHGQAAKVIGQGGFGLADDLLDLSERDGLLILSYGKPYKEVLLVANEAGIAGASIVLVTDTPNTKLARAADAIITARRGRAGRVALHASTLVALEALAIGLAAANQSRTMRTLARLGALRAAVTRD